MKKDEVPQDNNRTYGGHTKVIYAVNHDGDYEQVSSSGWETEQCATLMAVDALVEQTRIAHNMVSAGEASTLMYHMYAQRLDILGLAQATGFFQWRIKRHLRTEIFAKLSEKKRMRYADVLGISVVQ